jgi:ketosteroid isomerase-like protein
MKTGIVFATIMLAVSSLTYSQQADIKAIKKTVSTFSKAGDQNDVEALDKCLDSHYRIVMNQLFGSKELSVMTREVYMEKIGSKAFGGDEREVIFHEVLVNGNTACVKATLKGKKATFTSFFTLAKNAAGDWLLLSDVPVIG